MLIDELKQVRRSAGWSQRTLAERVGVDSQTIKRLEKGVGSMATLVAVMAALQFRLTGVGTGRTLFDQLRARRQVLALSISEAARRSGLSRTTIVKVEQGEGSVASLLQLLALISPKARRRAPERSYWGQGDKVDRDNRFTPTEFMANIYTAFGEIDLDPCGHHLSPVVARRRIMLSEGGDGLTDEWSGKIAFMNPPFSELLKWLRRAHDQWRAGNIQTVICLVPVRTDSALFHNGLSADADIYLLQGRIAFLDLHGNRQPTPFSLMVLTLGATANQKAYFAKEVAGCWLTRVNPRNGASVS